MGIYYVGAAMIYEILDDSGNVINTIVADEIFVNQHHPNRYRLVPEPPPPPKWIVTKVAFRFRLTDLEYTSILAAAKTDVEVQAWYETFNMVQSLDLSSERTIDGVTKLVSKGLLTQDRADTILKTPAEPNESPS